jgi:hypothetical protein
VARDKLAAHDDDLFILDAFNVAAYPLDIPAKAGINVKVVVCAHNSSSSSSEISLQQH